MIRSARHVLLVALLAACERPPEGIAVTGGTMGRPATARAEGFVVVHVRPGPGDGPGAQSDGAHLHRPGRRVAPADRFPPIEAVTVPEPLPVEEEAWLDERGFTYVGFEPDATDTGRILRGSYEPVGGGTPVWGTLVYERLGRYR